MQADDFPEMVEAEATALRSARDPRAHRERDHGAVVRVPELGVAGTQGVRNAGARVRDGELHDIAEGLEHYGAWRGERRLRVGEDVLGQLGEGRGDPDAAVLAEGIPEETRYFREKLVDQTLLVGLRREDADWDEIGVIASGVREVAVHVGP